MPSGTWQEELSMLPQVVKANRVLAANTRPETS